MILASVGSAPNACLAASIAAFGTEESATVFSRASSLLLAAKRGPLNISAAPSIIGTAWILFMSISFQKRGKNAPSFKSARGYENGYSAFRFKPALSASREPTSFGLFHAAQRTIEFRHALAKSGRAGEYPQLGAGIFFLPAAFLGIAVRIACLLWPVYRVAGGCSL